MEFSMSLPVVEHLEYPESRADATRLPCRRRRHEGPSAGNSQAIGVVVVTDEDVEGRLPR
jgi:hypothetical protein